MALETPTGGGRVLLTRGAVSEDAVVYDVALNGPDGTWLGTSSIDIATGQLELGPFTGTGEAPGWLVESARTFLRTVWSQRKKENPPVWPRSVRRWRAPKDA